MSEFEPRATDSHPADDEKPDLAEFPPEGPSVDVPEEEVALQGLSETHHYHGDWERPDTDDWFHR